MSVAQTLVRPPTVTPRRRYVAGLAPGAGFDNSSAIDRLDSHALHQGRDTPTADHDALAAQKVAQHAGPCERALQMQFVDPAHDAQVFGRNRTGLEYRASG